MAKLKCLKLRSQPFIYPFHLIFLFIIFPSIRMSQLTQGEYDLLSTMCIKCGRSSFSFSVSPFMWVSYTVCVAIFFWLFGSGLFTFCHSHYKIFRFFSFSCLPILSFELPNKFLGGYLVLYATFIPRYFQNLSQCNYNEKI